MNLNIPFQYSNVREVDCGLTNTNYLLTIDEKTYIARVPNDDLKHLFNREHEKEVLEALKDKDFTLTPLYYNDGIQVVAYEEKLVNFNNYKHNDRIFRVSQLMKTFHRQELKVSFAFNPIKQCEIYASYTKDLDIDLADYTILFESIKKIDYKPVLCHNDWVEGNICFLNDDTYLIDFEYAGNNDKRFDIMSFITENTLTNDEKREFLDLMYPEGIDHMEEVKLCLYRDLNNLLWYLWAKMMHSVRQEKIYDDIAIIKLNQLKNEYQKPLNF